MRAGSKINGVLPFPYAGITQFRLESMISALPEWRSTPNILCYISYTKAVAYWFQEVMPISVINYWLDLLIYKFYCSYGVLFAGFVSN